MNKEVPFKAPSKHWLWLIIPFVAVSIMWTSVYTVQFIQAESPPLFLKYMLIAGIISVFLSFYILMGYSYLQWVAPKKNTLYNAAIENPDLLYQQFNRIFINDEIAGKYNISPRNYKSVQQRDLRDIVKKISG